MSTKDTNPKDAIGCAKPPLSCVPMNVVLEIGAGMLEGSCKYGRHNYREAGVRSSIYFDATMRHLIAWWEGEDIDPDSGLSHITKALASLVVLRDAQMNGMVANDDRPPRLASDWMDKIREQVTTVLGKYPNPKDPHVHENPTSVPEPSDGSGVSVQFFHGSSGLGSDFLGDRED